MASVHKKKKRPYWFCAFREADGKRVYRSTETRNKEQAIVICRKWEKAGKLGRAGKLNPDEVRSVLSEGLREVFLTANKQPMPNDTVNVYATDWLVAKKLELEPTSYQRYEGVLTRFLGFLGTKADQDLAVVTAADITRFRDEQAKNLSSASSELSLKVLRVFFGSAYREERVSKNVASLVPKLKSRKSSVRRGLTIAEIKRLLVKAKKTEWEGLIICGLYTGARLGDLARLTWRSVDLERNTLSFVTRKTERPMDLPLAKPLLRYIENLPSSDDPNAPLFPESYKIAQKSSSMLSSGFYNLMADTGLVTARAARHDKPTGKGRNAARPVSPISFHSLRHSATTFLKAAGVSDVMAREIIGHDTEAISRGYTHLTPEDLREAIEKLPDITKKQKVAKK